ncbi:MAG TPA: HNH endonuclease [Chthonomonadales bacterium]|nr:HNH endonuclease [Chthonomonadales bacterium]
MNGDVLVLNSDYEPLNVCHVRRALVMIYLGKADVLHEAGRSVIGYHHQIDAPSVVKLRHHVKRPLPKLRLSRRTVFARDNYTCQYCGHTGSDLTIDHVVPRRHGGATIWENVVTACRRCNMKKSDKLPGPSGMSPKRQPRRPRYVPYISLTKYLVGRRNEVWRVYLPTYADVPD